MFTALRLSAVLPTLILAAAASGCATAPASRHSDAPPVADLSDVEAGKGRIIVYRESGPFGLSAIRPMLYLNESRLGPAFACAYRVIDTTPGEHAVRVGSLPRNTVKVNVAAGETVYLQAVVSTGADLLEGALRSAEPDTAAAKVRTLNYVSL